MISCVCLQVLREPESVIVIDDSSEEGSDTTTVYVPPASDVPEGRSTSQLSLSDIFRLPEERSEDRTKEWVNTHSNKFSYGDPCVVYAEDYETATTKSLTSQPVISPTIPSTSFTSPAYPQPGAWLREGVTAPASPQPWADPPNPTRAAFVASAPSSPQPGPSGWHPQSPKERKPAGNSDRFPCGASVGDAQCPCDVCMGIDVNCQQEDHIIFTDPPASPSAASTVCFCRQCQQKEHNTKCWMHNSIGCCDCSMNKH